MGGGEGRGYETLIVLGDSTEAWIGPMPCRCFPHPFASEDLFYVFVKSVFSRNIPLRDHVVVSLLFPKRESWGKALSQLFDSKGLLNGKWEVMRVVNRSLNNGEGVTCYHC